MIYIDDLEGDQLVLKGLDLSLALGYLCLQSSLELLYLLQKQEVLVLQTGIQLFDICVFLLQGLGQVRDLLLLLGDAVDVDLHGHVSGLVLGLLVHALDLEGDQLVLEGQDLSLALGSLGLQVDLKLLYLLQRGR
jgi:hypothetical protein